MFNLYRFLRPKVTLQLCKKKHTKPQNNKRTKTHLNEEILQFFVVSFLSGVHCVSAALIVTAVKMMCTKILTLLSSHPLRRLPAQTCFTCFTIIQKDKRACSTVSLASGSCFIKTDFQKQRRGLSDIPYYGLNNVRSFSLSPAGIVSAAPVSVQPYLRLMRLDKPIGELLSSTYLSDYADVKTVQIHHRTSRHITLAILYMCQ